MPTFREDLHLGHKVPTVDTADIVNGAITEPKLADDSVSTRTIQDGAVTEPKLADGAVSMRTLGNDVKTEIQKGTQRAWNPREDYDVAAVYGVNDLVYDPVTNSSYLSLRADNMGHAVTDEDWWMKVVDGSYVNTMVEELEQAIAQAIEDAQQDIADAIAGANTAAEAATAAKNTLVTEISQSLAVYETVADTIVTDPAAATGMLPVQNYVIGQALIPVNSYVRNDVRVLAAGQVYQKDEAVKTSDGAMVRMTQDIKAMTTTDAVAVGDLKVYGGSSPVTYKALKAIEPYDSTATYEDGDYALGRPSVYTITVAVDGMAQEGGISVTIGDSTVQRRIVEGDTAITIASAIASELTIDGWSVTDNEDGTITITSLAAGANVLSFSYTETGSTNVSIEKSADATSKGTLTTSIYSASTGWSNASLAVMKADTNLYTALTVSDLLDDYTSVNDTKLDLEARTAYKEDVDFTTPSTTNLVISASGTWTGNSSYKHKIIAVNAGEWLRIEAGNSYAVNYTFLTSNSCTVDKAAPYSAEAVFPYTSMAKNTMMEVQVPSDAKYLYLRWKDNNGTYYIPSRIQRMKYVKDVLTERVTPAWIGNNDYLWQTYRMNKIIDSFTYQLPSERTGGLCLVHCSDMHGDASNLARIVQFAGQNAYVDDMIHTGDIVYYTKSDSVPIQSAGAEKMLQTIGNHDHWGNRETAYTDAQKFARYMSNIGSWGVVYESDKCYYYKDYYNDTRLIVLDCMQWSGSGSSAAWNAAQQEWFVNTLASARAANRRVIVATHCPVSTITDLNNGFSDRSTLDMSEINTYCPANVRTAIKTAVQNFIDAGGVFVCYLTGHTHFNKMGWLTDYPGQLQITMTNSGAYKKSDSVNASAYKHRNLINRDEFNVMFVRAQYLSIARFGRQYNYWWQKADTICIDYVNKEVIGCG